MIFHSMSAMKSNMSKVKLVVTLLIFLLVLTGCKISSWFGSKKDQERNCDSHYPVCGEDGVTYYNACQADDLGANIIYQGACNNGEIITIPYAQETEEVSGEEIGEN